MDGFVRVLARGEASNKGVPVEKRGSEELREEEFGVGGAAMSGEGVKGEESGGGGGGEGRVELEDAGVGSLEVSETGGAELHQAA